MSPIQHLRPVNLRERLCQWFHRAPQTPIPHWDAIVPPDKISRGRNAGGPVN